MFHDTSGVKEMSDFVLGKNIINEKSAATNTTQQKNRFRTFALIVAFALIVLAFLLLFCYYFLFLPQSSVAKIKLSGNTVLSEVYLKEKCGLRNSLKWNQVDSMQVARRIANISMIESVVVDKKLPDSVYIKITERKPIALTFVAIDDCSLPAFIDKSGVVFTSKEIKNDNLVVISGLSFENFTEGMHLNSELLKLLHDVSALQNSNQKLLNRISEIKVVAKKYAGYELVLFPIGDNIRVRILDELTSSVIEHALLVLDVVHGLKNYSDIREIDLRSGIAVIESNTQETADKGGTDE